MLNTIQYMKLVVGQIQTNCYLIYFKDRKNCLILDPGDEGERIIALLKENNLTPVAILLTHSHIDHCGSVNHLANFYQLPLFIHRLEIEMIKSYQKSGLAEMLNLSYPQKFENIISGDTILNLLEDELQIIHTPGHSPGSICIKYKDTLFSGDTVFAGSIGRTDLPGGDFSLIQKSLQKIKILPKDTIILPGHGETTDLNTEISFNPFFNTHV